MLSTPDVELDLEHSTIRLGDAHFPACILRLPGGVSGHGMFWDGITRTGDRRCDHGWQVTVPFETGASAKLVFERPSIGVTGIDRSGEPVLQMFLHVPLYVTEGEGHEMYAIAERDCLRGVTDPYPTPGRGHTYWNGEPWWIAETIERFSRRPVDHLDELQERWPRMVMMSLTDWAERRLRPGRKRRVAA